MAELADAADSKSADLRVLGVRLPLPAPEPNPFTSEMLDDIHYELIPEDFEDEK